jgi:hypothetical protein
VRLLGYQQMLIEQDFDYTWTGRFQWSGNVRSVDHDLNMMKGLDKEDQRSAETFENRDTCIEHCRLIEMQPIFAVRIPYHCQIRMRR